MEEAKTEWWWNDPLLMNVRSPAAELLVKGIKSVENRSAALSARYVGRTVLVVASKSPPSKKALAEMQALVDAHGQKKCRVRAGALGAIVGVVMFGPSYAGRSTNPWESDTTHHWPVVYALDWSDEPIESVQGCQTPLRWLHSHPDRDRIANALRRRLCPS